MSVRREHALTLLLAGLPLAGPAQDIVLPDDEQVDVEFLEYLGSWSEGDADWEALLREPAELESARATPDETDGDDDES